MTVGERGDGVRPELAGKGFTLIEFLLARLAEDADRLPGDELERRRATVDHWQDIEVAMQQRYSQELFNASLHCAAECRRLAAAHYSDHPGFLEVWGR